VLREHGVFVSFEPSALQALLEGGGYDPSLGARPMRRTVGRLVEAKLAKAILAGAVRRGDRVVARGCGACVELDRMGDNVVAAE
jgi:ATP-dependent Clp protease ATP-binding subunit ClpC